MTILKKDISKDILESMKRKYEGNARVKRTILQALRKEFKTLEMKTGETIIDYFSRIVSIANRMCVHGEQMRYVTIVENILRSSNDIFNYIVLSIEEFKNIDEIFIDELQISLIVHEQKFHKKIVEEQVLRVSYEETGGGRVCDRNSFRGRDRGRGHQSSNKAIVECYKCHKLGHYQ